VGVRHRPADTLLTLTTRGNDSYDPRVYNRADSLIQQARHATTKATPAVLLSGCLHSMPLLCVRALPLLELGLTLPLFVRAWLFLCWRLTALEVDSSFLSLE